MDRGMGRKKKQPQVTDSIMQMAERVRFELTVLAYTRVPGVHLKPLGHLSGCENIDGEL
jgi:hypothetical protein